MAQNVYHSNIHFVQIPREDSAGQEWGPGYIGAANCEACGHVACERCRFLSVDKGFEERKRDGEGL